MKMILPQNELLCTALNAIPHPVLLFDAELKLLWANETGLDFLAGDPDDIILRRGGEILHCANAGNDSGGCGNGPECRTCPIRSGTRNAIQGKATIRQPIRIDTADSPGRDGAPFMLTVHPFTDNGDNVALLFMEDFRELHALRQLLPICSHCKRIRCPDDSWEPVETHMTRHAAINFTHGLCPTCMEEHYGDLGSPIQPGERF